MPVATRRLNLRYSCARSPKLAPMYHQLHQRQHHSEEDTSNGTDPLSCTFLILLQTTRWFSSFWPLQACCSVSAYSTFGLYVRCRLRQQEAVTQRRVPAWGHAKPCGQHLDPWGVSCGSAGEQSGTCDHHHHLHWAWSDRSVSNWWASTTQGGNVLAEVGSNHVQCAFSYCYRTWHECCNTKQYRTNMDGRDVLTHILSILENEYFGLKRDSNALRFTVYDNCLILNSCIKYVMYEDLKIIVQHCYCGAIKHPKEPGPPRGHDLAIADLGGVCRTWPDITRPSTQAMPLLLWQDI